MLNHRRPPHPKPRGVGPAARATALRAVVLGCLGVLPHAPGVATASPAAPSGSSEQFIEAWREDLETFRSEVILPDRAFTTASRAAALDRLTALESRLDLYSEAEIAGELAKIAALAGNAHTRIDPLRNRGLWARLPIRLWKFADGWRVVSAREEQSHLIGLKLVGIGEATIAEAEAAVAPLFAGNEPWRAYMAGYSLTSPEALAATGIARPDPVVLTFAAGGAERRVALAPEARENRTRPEENWWHLAREHPRIVGWRRSAPDPEALVFRQPELGYVMARCEGGAVYIRLNRTADQQGRPPLAEWGGRVLQALQRDPPTRLIIDLRFNTGGDLSKALPFIGAIAASPLGQEHDRLAVLINGQTFSAGITQAAWLRLHSQAEFYGEPVGDFTSFWAEGDNVVLPRSGLTARYSTGAHHYSDSAPPMEMKDDIFMTLPAPDLGPDHVIGWTWTGYQLGRDPALDAAAPDLTCGAFD